MVVPAQDDTPEPNPLLLWVAYIPGVDVEKKYLSDGDGHLRIFKTEVAANEWLDTLSMTAEFRASIVVHSIQGQIAVPVEDTAGLSIGYEVNQTPAPIHTFAAPTVPTASEQIESLLKRRKIRMRK